ncbi:MAG: flavocytochrome c [Candidatus Limiplasma sp.]|nr:flavocytochrome c [Candidatus Limiplasma sp.]
MKKILSLILCVALLAMGTTALAAAGTYTGVGDSQIGGAGSIEVSVTVDESGAVTAVEVTKNGDTPGISDPAVEQVPARIVELQTANVDGVSGATMTSQAISAAVLNAVEQAGLDVEAWNTKKEVVVEKAPDVEMTADVVIIGAGGAGLAAAVQANQNGASVIVLEKMGKVGGNTILAGGALNAVDDRSETAIKQNDSVEWHYQQTLSGGDYQGDPVLVHTLVSNAWAGVEWLKELGMEFDESKLFTVTGGLWERAHKPVMPVGTGFFDAYNRYIDTHEGVEVLLNTRATEITVGEDGRVNGVIATGETGNTVTVKANNGVIVATGGFAKSVELRQAYNTQWADLGESIKSTNHEGATGDGIKMMMKLGADFIQMGNIQLLPLGDPETGSLSGNIEMNVETRIFINKEGNRFVNEGGRRDEMTQALFEQTDNYMWIVMDSDKYPTGDEKNNFNESVNELIAAGRAVKGETLEELAAAMNVPAENLIAAVEDFNAHVASGEPDAFGRTLYETPIDNGPFYAAPRVPTVHHTMGGVRINQYAQVINENGAIIPGLYAAGEVTGGIHGANRLGGNALTDTVVFGRIAGDSASQAR